MTKTLMLGFDGGDPEIFKTFDMPFLESLIAEGKMIAVHEDLLTRGWSRIITGRSAEDTGGLYFRPELADKTPTLNNVYNLKTMTANAEVAPIWRLLNDQDVDIGMMGVPTTSPAPKVNGFAVSGGGGSVDKIDGIPEGYCSSPAIIPFLQESNFLFDVRLGTSGVKTFPEFIKRVENVLDSSVSAYLKLYQTFFVPFNFVVFRPTTGLQYLARYDIQRVSDLRNAGHPLHENGQLLMEHYRFLDECIRRLFEGIAPDRYLLVADHGTQIYRAGVNINALLQENGLQARKAGATNIVKFILKTVSQTLPKSVRSKYGRKMRAQMKGLTYNFDRESTLAFGHYHVPGVYVNDADRFNGPVGEDEYHSLVERVCTLINCCPSLSSLGFHAKPFRSNYFGKFYEKELPDVWIDGPDTHFFVGNGPLIHDNKNFRETPFNLGEVYNPFSGVKGQNPIFCTDKETAKLVTIDDERNLTLAYKLVSRIYDLSAGAK